MKIFLKIFFDLNSRRKLRHPCSLDASPAKFVKIFIFVVDNFFNSELGHIRNFERRSIHVGIYYLFNHVDCLSDTWWYIIKT